jgi:serine/threonine protein kinase
MKNYTDTCFPPLFFSLFLKQDQCCAWILQLLEALACLHSHHIYVRGLKPENIFIQNNEAVIGGWFHNMFGVF